MNEKTILLGLLQACPYDTESVNCPLREIRKQPWEQRLEWADKLTIDEIHEIVQRHYDEAGKKEQNINF
ncbi:MAG: hypothetical protein GY752_03635 [bacterium]|nr:hypothetical protein [bacterium]MCP4800483.1 hypothetical protein [bacterium]